MSLAHRWAIAGREGARLHHNVLVKLTDADGLVGIGESAPASTYHESAASSSAFLAKVDASKLSFDNIPASMAALDAVGPGEMAAKCAINIALVDGAARRAGKAVYDYLGIGFEENKHITSMSIGIDTPESVRQKTKEAERYPVLKLKVGDPRDKENLAAVRDVAPTKLVRVDANEGWKTKEHALEMLEWLAKDGRIEFVEQPMPHGTSAKDLIWLKARTPVPIFADESYHGASNVEHCAECYHGVNVKLVKAGGITPAYDALVAARKAGLKTMIGCMIETSILITAGAHLANLSDHLDLDGNLLATNDPYEGATAEKGMISFANTVEKIGLRVRAKA